MSAPDALPVARRIASMNSTHPSTSEPATSQSRDGNTSPAAPYPDAAAVRVGKLELRRLMTRLSDRDEAILRDVAAHRFLTSRHLEQLHFTGHASAVAAARSCNRVLDRLRDWHLLISLDRRIGGTRAGSSGQVWHLSHAGCRLLALLDGEGATVRHFHEPSQRLLDHTLLVADIHLMLRVGVQQHRFDLVHLELEPDSWRHYLGLGGEPHLMGTDLRAITATGQYEDHWLLEADTGSEHPPTVVRTCRRYLDYFATGVEQQTTGVVPRVVWVVPHSRRATKLQEAFSRAHLDPRLFRVTTLEGLPDLVAEGAL